MSLSKTILAPTALLAMASLGLGGCATKDYVNEQIATVNHRVDATDAKLATVETTAEAAKNASLANNAEIKSAQAQAQDASVRVDQLSARVDRLEQGSARKRPRH